MGQNFGRKFKFGNFFEKSEIRLSEIQKIENKYKIVHSYSLVFSLDEIDKLMEKAVHIVGTSMHPFRELYRCKPYFYWDQIRDFRGGVIEKYIKDNNGQAASPINGQIYGIRFSHY